MLIAHSLHNTARELPDHQPAWAQARTDAPLAAAIDALNLHSSSLLIWLLLLSCITPLLSHTLPFMSASAKRRSLSHRHTRSSAYLAVPLLARSTVLAFSYFRCIKRASASSSSELPFIPSRTSSSITVEKTQTTMLCSKTRAVGSSADSSISSAGLAASESPLLALLSGSATTVT